MKIRLVLALLCLLALPAMAHAKLPMSIAGLSLGESVDTYSDICMQTSEVTNSDAPFITEIDIMPGKFAGVRGGTIGYANCDAKRTIVWIKLKFDDTSPKLFNKLLKSYRRTLGDDPTWSGDAFQIIKAWKWIMTDATGTSVEVLLAHSKNPEFRPGVSVKMTLRSLFNTEQACYWKAQAAQRNTSGHMPMGHSKLDIGQYTPR